MKRRALILMTLAACSQSKGGPLPVIERFEVDEPNPEIGAPVTFTFSVTGATGIGIYPIPGGVVGNRVTVTPPGSTVFTLQAFNDNGQVARDLAVTVRRRASFSIDMLDALPGQVGPGGQVNITWAVTGAARLTLSDPAGSVTEVTTANGITVQPRQTTAYTLTAYNQPGHLPESLTATVAARVLLPPSVGALTATPAAIEQGDASVLSWTGNAVSWSVRDDRGAVFNVGPRRSLLVRPSADTTYTLSGSGPGGAVPGEPAVRVSVTPHPATRLSYQPPARGALRLLADACADPCAAMTLRLRAVSPVSLRGFALTIPADLTKVGFDPSSFVSSLGGAPARATLGTGPLSGALVMGAALPGNGSAPAADVSLAAGAELARFTLTVVPAGGRGNVFSGAAPEANRLYKALVQSAAGRTADVIAVGSLDAD